MWVMNTSENMKANAQRGCKAAGGRVRSHQSQADGIAARQKKCQMTNSWIAG